MIQQIPKKLKLLYYLFKINRLYWFSGEAERPVYCILGVGLFCCHPFRPVFDFAMSYLGNFLQCVGGF